VERVRTLLTVRQSLIQISISLDDSDYMTWLTVSGVDSHDCRINNLGDLPSCFAKNEINGAAMNFAL